MSLIEAGNTAQNFERLLNIARGQSTSWIPVMNDLRNSSVESGIEYFGFERAPASYKYHHNYPGGLVVHLLEMWETHCRFSQSGSFGPFAGKMSDGRVMISDKNVFDGIMLHDLHKAHRNYTMDAEGNLNYSRDFDMQGVPRNYRSMSLMPECLRDSTLLLNVLSASEGGWAKEPPYTTTPLAKYVYLLDEFSANVLHGNFAV